MYWIHLPSCLAILAGSSCCCRAERHGQQTQNHITGIADAFVDIRDFMSGSHRDLEAEQMCVA